MKGIEAKSIREGLTRKTCCSFGFCPNEWGVGPAHIFCHIFRSVFLVNININIKCQYFVLKTVFFSGCIIYNVYIKYII